MLTLMKFISLRSAFLSHPCVFPPVKFTYGSVSLFQLFASCLVFGFIYSISLIVIDWLDSVCVFMGPVAV